MVHAFHCFLQRFVFAPCSRRECATEGSTMSQGHLRRKTVGGGWSRYSVSLQSGRRKPKEDFAGSERNFFRRAGPSCLLVVCPQERLAGEPFPESAQQENPSYSL